MCLYGVYKWVNVINPEQNTNRVKVDACIADEIKQLNDQGMITLGCCCGHGEAGKRVQWENDYGKWKGEQQPPVALIDSKSVEFAKNLGYIPYPYYYADDQFLGVWQMQLKTGCITYECCRKWHEQNGLPFRRDLDIIDGRGAEAPTT